MKLKVNSLMILALCGMLAGCTGGGSKTQVVEGSPYSQLNGRKAKTTYDTLTTVGIGKLNYLQTSAAQNANHFANFVDGLLTHNEFGVLELNLAESARHDENYTSFTFKVRQDENLVWVNYKGKPYKHNGKVQYVKAKDFVTGAKLVSTFSTASDTFYLVQDFIEGALEYYLYTQILDGQAQGSPEFEGLSTPKLQAKWINDKIKKEYKNIYTAGGYDTHPITANDIPNIENGSRFGVTYNEATNEVTYKLIQSAMYFPTLLTYSCYLPVNEEFYNEHKDTFGAAKPESILYNGPYYLSKLNETNIIYKKNTYYANRADIRGFMKVHVDTVKYNIIKSEITDDYTRKQFEAGNIDGFGLSNADVAGWKKYVTGPNDEGTIEDPYNGLVNSRLLDTIGNCYGTNIVMERSGAAAKSYSSYTKKSDLDNTKLALRLQDVRQAIMTSFDYPTYHKRYANGEVDSIFATQQIVHTYVPRNFVYDNNGNEYTETYYAAALAENKGITLEEAQALIEPGQYETRQATPEQVTAAVNKAKQAIADFNAQSSTKITYPIYIEYFSMWDAQPTDKHYDVEMIDSMNERLNGIEFDDIDLKDGEEYYDYCDTFRVVPTDLIDKSNYETVSGSNGGHAAFDFAGVQWGWGADYGDPLTYMNTYTKGGDWKSVFDFIDAKTVPNIRYDENGNLEEVDLLAEYTEIVQEGKKENENLNDRYALFAEAEVMLIEDLAIYKPQVNYGQGWSLSISKSAGYEVPTSNYGLSNDRFTGMWVLTEPLTREERKAIRAEFDAAKEDYTSKHPAFNIYGEDK